MERKLLGEATSRKRKVCMSQSSESPTDDVQAMAEHVRELQKEGKKMRPDRDKLVRLQSDSYVLRERQMCDLTSNTRPQETIKLYPFFKKPLHVSLKFSRLIDTREILLSNKMCVHVCIVSMQAAMQVSVSLFCLNHALSL